MKFQLLAGVIVVAASLFTLGCEVDDFAAGAVVGGVIGSHYGHSHYRHYCGDGHYHHRCHYRDGYYYYYDSNSSNAQVNQEVTQLAKTFDLSQRSASDLYYFLTQVEQGNQNAMVNAGLNKNEQKRLADLKMPSNHALQQFSQNFGMDFKTSATIFATYLHEASIQFKDINSSAWDTCINYSGTWATPQNLFCENTSTNGCSPQTGASTCVPRK